MSKKPNALPVQVESIPAELKKHRQWVAWHYQQRDGNWTKVPICCQTGAGASSTNSADWCSFEEAVAYYQQHKTAGIGFVFSASDPFAGVDLDDCLDPETGKLQPWAEEPIKLLDTYAEVSPSGTGVKLYLRGKVPGPRRRKGPVELYDQARYFAVTGVQWPNTPPTVESRQKQLDLVYEAVFEKSAKQKQPEQAGSLHNLSDKQIIRKAKQAKNGEKFQRLWSGDWSEYTSQSEADQALCSLLAFWCGPDPARIDRLFRQSGLYREKWERVDYREGTIETAISGCESFYQPRKSDEEHEEDEVSLVDRMMLIVRQNAELFHTEELVPFATVAADDHRETWAVESAGFRHWLLGMVYRGLGKVPKTHQLDEALHAIAARACFDGEERPVSVRVAEHENSICLDLGNKKWQAVEVTAKGWQVVDTPAVRFRRPKGMRALPLPEPGGSIDELRSFLNLASEDDFRLVVAWVLMALRPKGPYPLLTIHGEQGSCKSTMARLLRDLVDPFKARLRKEPHEVRDLMIAATNSHVLAYDNVSYVEPWLSDSLCTLATGGGLSVRLLYSDDEEKIFEVCRPILINGITELATRPDLLDRTIVLTLPVVPEGKRRQEEELFADFAKAHPRIFGALLDGLVVALANQDQVKLDVLPRMADFAIWATAAESAFGWPKGSFMSAYTANMAAANEIALEDSPIVSHLRKLVQYQDWPEKGKVRTADDLLHELVSLAGGHNMVKTMPGWPKRARDLAGLLRRLAPVLRRSKVFVEFLPRETTGMRRRPLRIWMDRKEEQ